jgi:hypothetical protein
LLLPLLLGCAGAGASLGGNEKGEVVAARGFDAWIVDGQPKDASARFARAIAETPTDAWARYGAALLARRELDEANEVAHLIALLRNAPRHPLGVVAARRLGSLAELAPANADAVEAGLRPLLDGGALQGATAHRARLALLSIAEARGNHDRSAALRSAAGYATSWTLLGPLGALHAMELDKPFPPEEGPIPEKLPGPPGLGKTRPMVLARAIPAPDGMVTLEGEPSGGDIFYFATDATVARGGAYLLYVGSNASFRAWVDGRPALERRAFLAHTGQVRAAAVTLEPGAHRLLVKVGRGGDRASLALVLARADGAPSDARFQPARGPRPGGRSSQQSRHDQQAPQGLTDAASLSAALAADGGPLLSALAAAGEMEELDREGAKALLAGVAATRPDAAESPFALAVQAELLRSDPTLADRIGRARAEGALEGVLARDPADAASRIALVDLLRSADRFEPAQALMSALTGAPAGRAAALHAGARLAHARGFHEAAERLAQGARKQSGHCGAGDLLLEMARRREAVAPADELAMETVRCPGGQRRLAEHRRLRGDPAGQVSILSALATAAPARIDPALELAEARIAQGKPAEAARGLAELTAIWPRSGRVLKKWAEALDLAGDEKGAVAARERALAADGADLQLRRALALERGAEPLAQLAENGRKVAKAYRASGKRYDTSSVVVLDSAAMEVHPDGAITERIHQLVELKDQHAADRFGEVSLPPGAQILSLRTLKPDGRTLEPEDLGERRSISLPGLEPGDFVEYEYLRALPARSAALPGFTADPFYFRVADTPLWRSQYRVIAPEGTGMEVDAHNRPAATVKTEGGRERLELVERDVPALVPEPGSAAVAEFLPFVQVGAGASRQEMQLAVADAMLARTRPTVEVAAFARKAAAGRRGEALVKAVYDEVARTILGSGVGSLGWSDTAGHVLARGRGNRAILLKSAYTSLGIKARFAMVRSFTADPTPYRFPRNDLYGQVVLRVEHEGRTHWLDPSTRFAPFDRIPPHVRGQEALILPEPGEAPQVTKTPTGPEGDGREIEVRIALKEDGSAEVRGVERYLGYEAGSAKVAVERMDAATRRQAVEQALSRTFRGLILAELVVEGEQDINAPLTLRYRFNAPHFARPMGDRLVIENALYPARLGARFLSRSARTTPLLIANAEKAWVSVEIQPPPGFRPLPGPERKVDGTAGLYRRSEKAEGGTLRREDLFDLRLARIPPPAYPDFARFVAGVDAAQGEVMAFSR